MPILYFLDSTLFIKYDNNLYSIKLNDCMKNNFITNYKKCLKRLEQFLKTNKSKKINFNKGVIIVCECELNQSYKKIIFDIFYNLGITKIKYINIRSLLTIKNNEIVLNITDNYWQIYTKNRSYLIETDLFKNIYEFINIFIVKHKISNITILSTSKYIKSIATKIEKITKIKTYYLNEKLNYIFSNVEKKYKLI